MDKRVDQRLFVNDGSFMERFKQLQHDKKQKDEVDEAKHEIKPNMSGISKVNLSVKKKTIETKSNGAWKNTQSSSSGKLAFSLKQKTKLAVPPVKLAADEEEDEVDGENERLDEPAKRQKLCQDDAFKQASGKEDIVPPSPSDPAVRKVADKLASFVAKNGRQFEHITRQRNPGDTPFKFLYDSSCADYKYYEYRIIVEERLLAEKKVSQTSSVNGTNVPTCSPVDSIQGIAGRQSSSYHIPAAALYESNNDGELVDPPTNADPIEMMEFYMKKAAQEEKFRQPKHSKDEMPPPASLQVSTKRGHHMGDYIPPEELERFLANCNDVASQRAAREAAERAKIQADNVGHKLLSKMGWKEGEGLGSSKSGRADPVFAGNVKLNNMGVGASHPGEVTPEDDIYEQYKKRMMLGYRYRPNPLNNPRKAYY